MGYVTNVSPARSSKKNPKRNFFDLTLQTFNQNKRTVCFSSEKLDLISHIAAEGKGSEIKRFKRDENNSIIITDYSAVRKIEPNFKKVEQTVSAVTIASIMNEKPLYEIITVKGLVSDLMPTETTQKDGKR